MENKERSEISNKFVAEYVSDSWNNKLTFFVGKDGHTWIAKVVGSKGYLLLLENKKGELTLESLDNIKSASLFRPNKKRREVMGNREEVS